MKNTTVRLTKQFHFEMAHALYGYDGPCKNIHGHSYELSVTVIGKPLADKKNAKNGMVMDFADLNKIVSEHIIKKFDHSLVLNKNSPHKDFAVKNLLLGKVILLETQPTCENMVIYFAEIIRRNLSGSIKLHHLKLRETKNSYAEWFAEDN